ncbi:MAG: beta-ketoacyl synthase N-terminal-like domain-containing protein [Chloroflexota bacterium]
MKRTPLDDPIVVTGMGAYGAGAATPAALYQTALRGRSVGEWLTLPGLAEPVAVSRAPDPALAQPELRYARRLDRSAQLAMAAAADAVNQSRLVHGVDPAEVGVVMGSSRGPIGRTLESADELARGAVGPTASAESTPASLSGMIAQAYGFGAATATLAATCASAATAICMGALLLAAGEAEAVVVGGAEAPLIPLLAAQLRAARVVGWDEDPAATCKPFDARRNGLMMGEGAAALVLERASTAARRAVPILARLSGWAAGSDKGGRTGVTIDGAGLVRVTRRALERAGLDPAQIGYVNAHGTATRLNDPVEARALNVVFGRGAVPPSSSTKPITGHCLGATPALEAVIAIESLRNGRLPPTANHVDLDAECELDVVAAAARATTTSAVLSTSLGFWGVQAALIFEAA